MKFASLDYLHMGSARARLGTSHASLQPSRCRPQHAAILPQGRSQHILQDRDPCGVTECCQEALAAKVEKEDGAEGKGVPSHYRENSRLVRDFGELVCCLKPYAL